MIILVLLLSSLLDMAEGECRVVDVVALQSLDPSEVMGCITTSVEETEYITLLACLRPIPESDCIDVLLQFASGQISSACDPSLGDPAMLSCTVAHYSIGLITWIFDALAPNFNGQCISADDEDALRNHFSPVSYSACVGSAFDPEGYSAYRSCVGEVVDSLVVSADCVGTVGWNLQWLMENICMSYCGSGVTPVCQMCAAYVGMMAMSNSIELSANAPPEPSTTTTEPTSTTTTTRAEPTSTTTTTSAPPTTFTTSTMLSTTTVDDGFNSLFSSITSGDYFDTAVTLPAGQFVIRTLPDNISGFFGSLVSATDPSTVSREDAEILALVVGASSAGGLEKGQRMAYIIAGSPLDTLEGNEGILISSVSDTLTTAQVVAISDLVSGRTDSPIANGVFSVLERCALLDGNGAETLLDLAAGEFAPDNLLLTNLGAVLGGSSVWSVSAADAFVALSGGRSTNSAISALSSAMTTVPVSEGGISAISRMLEVGGLTSDSATLDSALKTHVPICQNISSNKMTLIADAIVTAFGASDTRRATSAISWILMEPAA